MSRKFTGDIGYCALDSSMGWQCYSLAEALLMMWKPHFGLAMQSFLLRTRMINVFIAEDYLIIKILDPPLRFDGE